MIEYATPYEENPFSEVDLLQDNNISESIIYAADVLEREKRNSIKEKMELLNILRHKVGISDY